jgi:L-amino acid N-acyltransferase YncA
VRVRPVAEPDAERIQAIYAPIVQSTHVSFETEAPTVEETRERIRAKSAHYPWLAAVDGEVLAGYAYAARHRERAAYRWCVEVSVYVHATYRGKGVGKELYLSLFERLRAQGFVNAFAGITLPNEASVGLHESLGFQPVGVYRGIGFKLGAWHDVGWWHLVLQEPPETPEEPRAP